MDFLNSIPIGPILIIAAVVAAVMILSGIIAKLFKMALMGIFVAVVCFFVWRYFEPGKEIVEKGSGFIGDKIRTGKELVETGKEIAEKGSAIVDGTVKKIETAREAVESATKKNDGTRKTIEEVTEK